MVNATKNEIKKFKKEYKEVLSKIKSYDRIAIFRHIMPDFDALGTQFGLYTWIKDNFPNKEVKCLGDNHVTFTPRGLFPEADKLSDSWFNEKFLAIVVDVGDVKRIADPRFKKADFVIKIDHHPATDNVFNLSVLDTETAAASELVVNMLISYGNKYKFSKKAAEYFYIALVGDSGRFQYNSTTSLTFETADFLCSKGIKIVDIYELMYMKEVKDLEFMKFVLNNVKVTESGTCYYVLEQKDLDRMGLTTDRGKELVNTFSNINGVKIWCSITEDITEPCFRISLRSRHYDVSKIANMFEGGGHVSASGAKINDLNDLDRFIKACDDAINLEK